MNDDKINISIPFNNSSTAFIGSPFYFTSVIYLVDSIFELQISLNLTLKVEVIHVKNIRKDENLILSYENNHLYI